VKDLKAELSAAQIDQKMLNLQLAAADDKLRREKSIAETRFHMTELSLDAAHRGSLEEQKSAFDGRLSGLFAMLSQKFNDFVTDGDSVEAIVDRVAAFIELSRAKMREFEQQLSELVAARGVLGITEGPILPIIEDLVKRASPDWEDWAQRVYGLATSDFSLKRSPDELKFGLEEAVVSSVRQSRISRRLEILRTEKKLLVSGKVPLRRSGKGRVTLLSVVSVVGCVHKLQKTAGRLDGYTLTGPRLSGESTEVVSPPQSFSTDA
jgi:hypothetical protein